MPKVRLKELRAYLGGTSQNTIYKWVERGLIPAERIGRTLFFDLEAVDRAMRSGGQGREKRPAETARRIADRISAEL